MTGALSTPTTPADGDFADEWQQWHTIRERDLAAPLGWLSINRLEWLDTQPSRFEGLPGTWWFDGPTAHLRPGDGESFDTRDFDLEPTGPGEVVDIDDVHIEVARRGDGYLIRVHDENAPTVRNFRGVPAYDADPAWVVEARFEPYEQPRPVTVGAVVAGGVAPSPSRSNGTCPASSAIRSRAIATSTASCSSSCAEPRCSTIVRTPRVFDAICTAVAPDAVRTFRTNHPTERV